MNRNVMTMLRALVMVACGVIFTVVAILSVINLRLTKVNVEDKR